MILPSQCKGMSVLFVEQEFGIWAFDKTNGVHLHDAASLLGLLGVGPHTGYVFTLTCLKREWYSTSLL